MSELTQELDKLIQKAAIDGALTPRAVEQFHAVLTSNGELRALSTANAKSIDELKKDLSATVLRERELRTKCEAWEKREKDLALKESQAEVLQMSVKYEQKRVDDHKEMMKTVFKPYTMRKSVFRSAQEPMGSGQCGTVNTSSSGEEEETEE